MSKHRRAVFAYSDNHPQVTSAALCPSYPKTGHPMHTRCQIRFDYHILGRTDAGMQECQTARMRQSRAGPSSLEQPVHQGIQ